MTPSVLIGLLVYLAIGVGLAFTYNEYEEMENSRSLSPQDMLASVLVLPIFVTFLLCYKLVGAVERAVKRVSR